MKLSVVFGTYRPLSAPEGGWPISPRGSQRPGPPGHRIKPILLKFKRGSKRSTFKQAATGRRSRSSAADGAGKCRVSPARRTGFPAAGQENIPSHCPRRVTGSPCAPLGTMSVPTLATKENKEGCLAFYAKLLPASLTRKARHWERRRSSWLLMNVPRQPLVGR